MIAVEKRKLRVFICYSAFSITISMYHWPWQLTHHKTLPGRVPFSPSLNEPAEHKAKPVNESM